MNKKKREQESWKPGQNGVHLANIKDPDDRKRSTGLPCTIQARTPDLFV
ncbi:hypothetical protein L917_13095 [Phytophthora nicotianae]|uniref:Uncharacterized protein n=1 Tax=Phytophthora nicotianae TaxID=4792 RepID=W2KRR1_PHYNI|nr:hypothetical protein L917_13095 [Phytophthora nicotianae]